jgi:hypothetical protein
MGEAARYEVVRRGMPELTAWFTPRVPRGTTFDVVGRRNASLVPRDLAGLQAFHALSPQDFEVTASLVDVHSRSKPPVQEIARLFGPRAEYDMRALVRLSAEAARDLSALGTVLERKCTLSAGHCFEYGGHLVEAGRPAQAAEAFQRGVDLAADRVTAARSSRWLVQYYLDKGETARARAIATEAASTGASGGLITLSRFQEAVGDYAGAQALLEQERERYGNRPQAPEEREESQDAEQDGDQLAGFYHRMARIRNQRGYEERFRETSRDAFPHGVERVDPVTLAGYPADGAFILKSWPLAERFGLRPGDIIVGLDGHRVRSRRQYILINLFSDDPEMTLVVFRHPKYFELKVRTPWRRLGVEMRSHKTAG